MSSIEEEPVAIASASTLETNKPTEAGFPFLSLPPEIRNMIYHHIFTPVRDETCWTIYADFKASVVKGFRRKCRFEKLAHNICLADYEPENGLHSIFGIADNYTHSGIILTCRTVFGEAIPIALSCMHIQVDTYFTDTDSRVFEKFLANMRQSQGAYLSKLDYTYYRLGANYPNNFVQCFNRSNIKIGYLGLHEWITVDDASKPDCDPVKDFVNILDGLKHRPARVEWADRFGWTSRPSWLEGKRAEFNTVVQAWYEKLAMLHTANPKIAPPLLRDFFPQCLDQSSD